MRGHREGLGKEAIGVAERQPIPFFDRDGNHHITLPVELDGNGEPPAVAELIGPDETGQVMHQYYRREPVFGTDPPWSYVEVRREAPTRPPAPGSSEALRRVLNSRAWPAT
jgi:hypothetical protein